MGFPRSGTGSTSYSGASAIVADDVSSDGKGPQIRAEKATAIQGVSDASDFPEGGLRAWSVVLGVRPI